MLRAVSSATRPSPAALDVLCHRFSCFLESLQRGNSMPTFAQAVRRGYCQQKEAAEAQKGGGEPDSHSQESPDAETGDQDAAHLKEALDASEAKVTELTNEIEQVKSQSLQVMADMENMRKRTQLQISEARQFALQGFCKSILDVADNLERALDSVPGNVLEASQNGAVSLESGEDGSVSADLVAKNLSSLHNGVAMSNKIMVKIFKDNGLEKLESEVGGAFDPNLHNAMFEVPTGDMEPGRIAAVMKQGYSLNGRVIRAADVGVAKAL